MQKEFDLLPLFEKFIKDSRSGKRLKADGRRIRKLSAENYEAVYKHLANFSLHCNFPLRIRSFQRINKRQLATERRYWNNFHRNFSNYLYSHAGCFDNYVGGCFKCIRCFFNYLKHERLLQVGDFHKKFYVMKEEIPVIVFSPPQLKFLINDLNFQQSLSSRLERTRQVVVFGCTVALRFSDIFNIKYRDIELMNGKHYLAVRSQKTETDTRVQLPGYVVAIIKKRDKRCKGNSLVFPAISLNQFNKNLRELAETAGWTHELTKTRQRRGVAVTINYKNGKAFRFCDLISSHIMRRTAITTMLMLGMPEHIVRKISGHATNSKSFYRYVNFAQSYLDTAVEKVFEQLSGERTSETPVS